MHGENPFEFGNIVAEWPGKKTNLEIYIEK